MMHENYQLSHQQAQSLQLELPLRAARTPSPQRRHRPASPNSSMVCDSARLASAILLGHTRCLKQYLEDLAAQPSTRRRSSSPTTNCGSIILDRREIPPKPAYDWVTVRRVLFYGNQSTEFEQDSSPLIWAVDCQEWSCLRLMCAVQNDGPSASPSIVYNPSHPQPVKRRIISSGVGDRSPTRTQGSVCCNQQAFSKEPLFPSEIDLESPACLNQGLRPLANVMLTVSFTNLSTSNMNGGGMDLRPWRSVRNSPRKSPSPIIVQPSGANRGCGANSVSLLGCGPKFSVRQLKRPTPYRTFWVRGCYTYQSLLDYFFAVGYEMVGTYYDVRNNIKPGCEHCKIDMEYFDYPNYPTDPNDMRNETFLNHFSQLELMLQSSRVSVNRLDSVIAFNALAISAGRRLAGWCCHGMEGDVTVNEDPSEPLIEWRILATLIDHGMDEFEWLEFLSPQQNLIGQALCVLAWPVHAWSTAESSKWTASICQRGMSSKYSESRRTRRRSSSPLGEKRALIHPPPFADFGVALKRQAFILLVNLWALGAFSSHHIVHRRSAAGITSGSRIWDPRPPGQRSHSYTATMDGGDLRRIMLKTISNLPPELGIVSPLLIDQKIL